MRHLLFIFLFFPMLLSAQPQQRKTCIDGEWRFFLGDGSAAITNPSVSEDWRMLDLPHDWSVETEAAQKAGGTIIGPFSTNSVGKYQTGHTVGGVGWYMKTLRIKKEELRAKRHFLYFEGAYNQTEVWVNGKKLYHNHYGYNSFRFDITDALKEDDNSIVVRVANEGNNTRWYAGSGIFRHVWLIRTPQLHLREWDTFVHGECRMKDGQVAETKAIIQATIVNESTNKTKSVVTVNIVDAQGHTVGSAKQEVMVQGNTEQAVSLTIPVNDAKLWCPDTPYLYKAVISASSGKRKDVLEKHFGIRSLEFTAGKGFLLNGRPTLLRGGCVHHDHGLLGAASYDRAEVRKLQRLKAQGYNAVRTSHGMPSEAFLNVCDTLGLMVIDEAFDQWLLAKNSDDYHRFFAEHSTHDVQTMVRRDRHHPCVVMWSIGNEIPGRIEPDGIAAAERLRQAIRDLDATRPVTAAICGWDQGDAWNAAASNWEAQDERAFRSLDVGGYNYLYDKYEHDHQTHPDRVMYGAESYPKQLSQNWDIVERLPYVVGDFVWTAMDYLGEAGIGSAGIRNSGHQSMFQDWPWFNGWCGDIDLIGQKKPQSYYHDVVWRQEPVTMAIERPIPIGFYQSVSAWGWQLEELSWTYPEYSEKDTLTVNVYSRAASVRLYLNGESMGDHQTTDTYWAAYRIPYRPGTLRVVNLDAQGKELPSEYFELQTTSAPVGLRLTPDRTVINAEGHDLAYVTIELIDAQGRVVTSNSTLQVQLATDGGKLLAAGNASPTDMESFRSTTPRLYQGRALAILTPTVGSIRLTATAVGLPTSSVTINVK